MGTAGSDAELAADTHLVKILKTKLGFGTDAFTPKNFKGTDLFLGDPIAFFLLSIKASKSLKSATTLISYSHPNFNA